MPEVHPTPPHAGKVGSFLSQSTAGLPNWAWLLVVGGGILAAIYIPKLLPGNQQQIGGSNATPNSGLGLAVDPTTGLPYAVEGLVPGGQTTTTPATTTPATTATIAPSTAPTANNLLTTYTRGGAGNIPIWTTPNAPWGQGNNVGGIPPNASIQVGPPTQGRYNNQPATYYSVSYTTKGGQTYSGFVGDWDLVNPPPATSFNQYVTWPYQGATSG